MQEKERKFSYQYYVEWRNVRVLLTTSLMGFVVGGTMAKLWMATTAELAKSGSLTVAISSPTSTSVDWCSLDSRSCISPRVSSAASVVGNVVTGTGLVVNGSDVVLGRRLGKLYFLPRPPELSVNATWESSVAETFRFQSHWYFSMYCWWHCKSSSVLTTYF